MFARQWSCAGVGCAGWYCGFRYRERWVVKCEKTLSQWCCDVKFVCAGRHSSRGLDGRVYVDIMNNGRRMRPGWLGRVGSTAVVASAEAS